MSARRQRGIALIAVLWVLLLLAFLAASFSSSTRTETNLARNLVENAKAEALADAGIYRAIAALATPVEEGGVRADGTPYGWIFGDGEVRLAVQDEGGKIDLNAASAELLRSLLAAIGLDEEASAVLADAIVDFRDEDDEPEPLGAEDADYRSAGLPFEAKDAPFELVEELLRVKDMTGAVYRLLLPAVTVYTGEEAPNESTAPPLVRAALSTVSPEDLDRDSGADAAEEEDDETGDEPTPIAPTAPFATPLSPLEQGGSDARSEIGIYSIHAEGRTLGGAVFARDAVARLRQGDDPPYLFYAWNQGRRELYPPDQPFRE